jgi:hypothetical protein
VRPSRSLSLALLLALAACADGGGGGGDDDGDRADADVIENPTPDAAVSTARFVAMGDTGTGEADQLAVAARLKTWCAEHGCDFVLLLGDNLYDAGADSVDDPVWQSEFEVPYADVDLPFYPVLGNHDYGGRLIGIEFGGLGNEFDKGPVEIAYSAHSSKWRLPAPQHTLRQGPVGIVLFDTNSILWGNTENGDAEAWWPTGRAEIAGQPWQLAVGHHPYRSNGAHGNAGDYGDFDEFELPFDVPETKGTRVKEFFDAHVCGQFDMYISGHDHTRQWLDAHEFCGDTELVVSGAGGKVKAFERADTPARWQDDAEVGFFYVEATADTLTGTFVDADGGTPFTYTLTR